MDTEKITNKLMQIDEFLSESDFNTFNPLAKTILENGLEIVWLSLNSQIHISKTSKIFCTRQNLKSRLST